MNENGDASRLRVGNADREGGRIEKPVMLGISEAIDLVAWHA